LLVFMHIFGPLFLLFVMWIHVMRASQPKLNPPRGLALGSLAMFVVLAIAWPATSHAPADLAVMPTELNLDWFYMMLYPVFDVWGAGPLWILGVGLSIIVAAMPWLPPLKRPKPAEVHLEKCNGCSRCYADCPFGAISMEPRSDGLPFEREAVVDASHCTSCGICVGSCPVSTPFRNDEELVTGIDMPDFGFKAMRGKAIKLAEKVGPDGVLVVGCDHGVDIKSITGTGVAGLSLPCIGMLPPSFIDFAMSRGGVAGVLITGCQECDCFARLGNRWIEERIAGVRDPYLRARVDRRRLGVFWASRVEQRALKAEIERFRDQIKALPGSEAGT